MSLKTAHYFFKSYRALEMCVKTLLKTTKTGQA